jgi:hypothetical protein
MRRSCVALIVLLLLVSAGKAQTYKIQLRIDPDEKKSVSIHSTSEQDVDSRIRDADGKEVKKRQFKHSLVEEYTETVLEKGDKRPGKFRRVYSKAVDGKKELPHQGRKLRYEKQAAGYKVSAEDDKDLPDAVAKRLGAEAAGQTLLDSITPLLPDKPVKVGETWTVSGKALAAAVQGATLDVDKSKGSGKLVKVYRKGKRLFGVIEFKEDLILKFKDKESTGKVAIRGSVDAVIDGSDTEGTYQTNLTITGQNVVEKDSKKFTVGGTTKASTRVTVSAQKE